MDDARATEGTSYVLEAVMNHLRDEITDAVIELVFYSFPHLGETQFRGFVHQVLRIVEHAAYEVLTHERHRQHLRNQQQSRN